VSTLGDVVVAGAMTTWVPLAGGALAMVVFVLRKLKLQKRNGALLDMRTFTSRNFTVSLVMMGLRMGALFGMSIVLPIYLRNVLGLSTLRTGLRLLPGGRLMGLLAPRVGRAFDRGGPRPLIIPGILIVSSVLWAMTLLGPQTPVANILAGHIVM